MIALPQNPIFEAIGSIADLKSMDCYVVGGFVRDLYLKRPSKDIDFLVVGDCLAVAEGYAKSISPATKVNYFKNFGTAMVKGDHGEVEFVTARKESYRSDSRNPKVEPGSLMDDLSRRDFTINALAIRVNKDGFGTLEDKFDGIQDLKRKIIKTPLDPDITFSDDPLRMMRAVRFASQLNFDIHSDTFEAIIKNKDRISIISKERITDELNKIILSPTPSYGFKLLDACGLLELIFPKFVELKGVETRDGKSHKDNFYHTLQVLDNLSVNTNDLWLRWAAILHDIAKPDTKRFNKKAGWTFHGHEVLGAKMVPKIFKSLRLPLNDKMKYVQKLVNLHLRPIALVKSIVTDSAIRRLLYLAGDDVEDLMMLCRADITSKNDKKVKRYLQNFDLVEEKLQRVEEDDQIRNFQPLIGGAHIMEMFDIKPSRVIGDIKEELTEAILQGKIKNNFKASYAFVKDMGKAKGLKLVKELPIPKSESDKNE